MTILELLSAPSFPNLEHKKMWSRSFHIGCKESERDHIISSFALLYVCIIIALKFISSILTSHVIQAVSSIHFLYSTSTTWDIFVELSQYNKAFYLLFQSLIYKIEHIQCNTILGRSCCIFVCVNRLTGGSIPKQ